MMRRILRACGATVVVIVLAGMIAGHFLYRVPVLMYHSINPEGADRSRLIVRPESFRRQMDFLKRRGFTVLSLDAYMDLLKSGARQPRRSVVITFDDGYADNYQHAYPIVRDYEFPATIFVVSEWIGNPDMLDAAQIRQLAADPRITIGSHSATHCELTAVPLETVAEELTRSKQQLEALVGRPVEYVCYPCGFFNASIKDLVIGAGYQGACATHPDKEFSLNDPYAVRRIRISRSADNLFIFWIQVSGYYRILKDWK